MRVLISGGSIAAFSAAWWLCHAMADEDDVQVTVLERDQTFRQGGQSIDIRSTGRTVIERMNLLEKVKKANTGEKGIEFVDDNGTRIALIGLDMFGDNTPTAELEILRGDLAQILYDKCMEDFSDKINVRFGNHIVHVEETNAEVSLTLASNSAEAPVEKYDLLVIAEGVGSPTRELVFPNEAKPRYMDTIITFFTMPRDDEQDGGAFARCYNTTGRRTVFLRPDNQGTTRAVLTYIDEQRRDVHKLSLDEQKQVFYDKFADAGWQTKRVLKGLQYANDTYTDTLRQVKMPRWRSDKGRIVLTGDTAWCVTPLGGIGTTLALIGSYVLANEIAVQARQRRGQTDAKEVQALQSALKRYEDIMRPIIDRRQNFSTSRSKRFHPKTSLGLKILNLFLRAVVSRFSQWLVKNFAPKGNDSPFPIPDYSATSASSTHMGKYEA